MSIFIDEKTKVIVQGITGRMAKFHTKEMIEYGTNVVAGVTPGKSGQIVEGVPVFDTVKDAVRRQGLKRVWFLFHHRLQLIQLWKLLTQVSNIV